MTHPACPAALKFTVPGRPGGVDWFGRCCKAINVHPARPLEPPYGLRVLTYQPFSQDHAWPRVPAVRVGILAALANAGVVQQGPLEAFLVSDEAMHLFGSVPRTIIHVQSRAQEFLW